MNHFNYSELCKIPALTSSFSTYNKFTGNHDHDLSSIDLFILNTRELNKLFINNYSPPLGNLILLGYVSAVESYFRTLIRKLILIDEYIHSNVAEKNVTYAAAYHHTKELLPEALLEEYSFASIKNIFDALREIVGIKGEKPPEIKNISEEFMKICELRHCCIHRFGKLGSKNATKLGIDQHSCHLEKTIDLTKQDIDELANITTNFVKVVNNYIYKFIMHRTYENKNKEKNGDKFYKTDWTWNFNKDKKRFKKYYDIFQTKEDTIPSIGMKETYNLFRTQIIQKK